MWSIQKKLINAKLTPKLCTSYQTITQYACLGLSVTLTTDTQRHLCTTHQTILYMFFTQCRNSCKAAPYLEDGLLFLFLSFGPWRPQVLINLWFVCSLMCFAVAIFHFTLVFSTGWITGHRHRRVFKSVCLDGCQVCRILSPSLYSSLRKFVSAPEPWRWPCPTVPMRVDSSSRAEVLLPLEGISCPFVPQCDRYVRQNGENDGSNRS